MKPASRHLKLIASTLAALTTSSIIVSAGEAVPIGEGAVPIGEGAVPIGEGAVPIGEGAVPVGEGAVPVGEGAVPVGEGAVPVGEGAVPVGEGAVPVGEGAVPVGEGAVPVGEGAVPVGEGAVPVGEGAVPVGEGAVPVGEGAVPVGEGAVPVGEGAVPVGEDAVPTKMSASQKRIDLRRRAMRHQSTAPLFAGTASDRLIKLDKRLAAAIRSPFKLSASALSEREKQNQQWSTGALASASSRAQGLFNKAWWEKNAKSLTGLPGYHSTKSAASWWQTPTWNDLAAVHGSGKPFEYVYDKNLTFHHDVIYVNAKAIASYADYVASAQVLANSADSASSSKWTPLGTFALSTSLTKMKAPHAVQLAVDERGNIAGVYTNWPQGLVLPIRGKVDPESQRVAFTIGSNKIVAESGLENLTRPLARLWVHLPHNHSQTWLAVRIPEKN